MHSESKTEIDPLVREARTPRKPFFWRSGCFALDPRFTIFACQFLISFTVMVTCVLKLISSDTCETQSFYGNILTTMIGLWMPSPLSKWLKVMGLSSWNTHGQVCLLCVCKMQSIRRRWFDWYHQLCSSLSWVLLVQQDTKNTRRGLYRLRS